LQMTPTSCPTSRKGRPAVLVLLAWAAIMGPARAQEIAVQNESGAPVKVTAAEIAGLPHQEVSVDDHGKAVRFGGVPLRLVLEKGGVTFGDSLRGKRLSSCLLVEAADGYRVVIALPELDPGFTDRLILLADQAEGHPIDSKEGPFRIVIPDERRMARWVRKVTALKVVQVQ
jgi:Oxidoreductase molybdopterin binding domain